MIATVHVLAGGVAGEAIGNPVLAFLAGFLLHIILDMIPHYDGPTFQKNPKGQYLFSLLDLLILIALLIYIREPFSWSSSFYWGAFGGILPDILDNLPYFSQKFFQSLPFGKSFHRFHENIQRIKPHWFIGLGVQVLVVLLIFSVRSAIN